jgi:hypothetical protein
MTAPPVYAGLQRQPPVPARGVWPAHALLARTTFFAHGIVVRRQRRRLSALVAMVTVLVLLLTDLEAQFENVSAREVGTAPASIGTSARLQSKLQPQARRFAWAPVAAAEQYDFELFQGPNLVYSAQTTRPQLAVPARWELRGRARSLTPGEYRWYVWPVVSGRRALTAVVQARLTVY